VSWCVLEGCVLEGWFFTTTIETSRFLIGILEQNSTIKNDREKIISEAKGHLPAGKSQ